LPEDQLEGIDVLVFDIQDIGVRFYTYISTLHYVMEACAKAGVPIIILDRPNPNGHYIDGPVLEPQFKSFLGMHTVPLVHGMTIGEYGKMINGEKWLKNKIDTVLQSLIDLKNLKEKNSSIKALAYQLYENNGVLKRENVSEFLKSLEQSDRKILRDLGVKFGRYHVFLHKLIKPEPVTIRTMLWKNYHQKYFKLKPPTFGLNFIDDSDNRNKSFMLLCGFEKFDNFFVRIDILERLFMLIINSGSEENKEIKLVPEMLNLLGCSKDNFKKLIIKMNYKVTEKNDEVFFRYFPKKKFKKTNEQKTKKENPFGVLKNLNFN